MGETGRKCLSEICVRTSGQQQLKQTPKRYLILYYQNSLFISHQSHPTIPDDNLPSWAHFENHYSKLSKFLLWNLVTPECISCLFFRYCSAELYWPGELSLLYAVLELSSCPSEDMSQVFTFPTMTFDWCLSHSPKW